jgi:hypothetical protein
MPRATRLRRDDGFTTLNTDLVHRRVRARRLDAAVPLQRLGQLPPRPEGRRATTRGLRQLARVGDLCPPPRHNFVTIPRIRSERPAFDLHYPQVAGTADFHASPDSEVSR